MTVESMTTAFAVLALVANVGTLLIVATAIAGRDSSLRHAVLAATRGWELWTAFLVAAVATSGSLYLSEVAHFVPCQLCWYQRIAMYPLAVILLVAALRKDAGIRIYVAILATIGATISTYHYLIQRFPSLDGGSCSLGVPCTTAYVMKFGFMTIPYMAFSGFTLILALMWAHRADSDASAASFAERTTERDESERA